MHRCHIAPAEHSHYRCFHWPLRQGDHSFPYWPVDTQTCSWIIGLCHRGRIVMEDRFCWWRERPMDFISRIFPHPGERGPTAVRLTVHSSVFPSSRLLYFPSLQTCLWLGTPRRSAMILSALQKLFTDALMKWEHLLFIFVVMACHFASHCCLMSDVLLSHSALFMLLLQRVNIPTGINKVLLSLRRAKRPALASRLPRVCSEPASHIDFSNINPFLHFYF